MNAVSGLIQFCASEGLNELANHFLSAGDCLNDATIKATSTKKLTSMKDFLQK